MYTIISGEIIHIACSGERSRHYLAEDHSINFEGSDGADTSYYENDSIDNTYGTLKINLAVIYDAWIDRENPWFYTTADYYNDKTGNRDYGVLQSISEDKATMLLDTFPENTPLDLIPFSDWAYSTDKIAAITRGE